MTDAVSVMFSADQAEKVIFRAQAEADGRKLANWILTACREYLATPASSAIPEPSAPLSSRSETITFYAPPADKRAFVKRADEEGKTLTDFCLSAARTCLAKQPA
jgi:uncharacterized protein (DUF1778 family)